jgi:hypothetical protein
VFADWIGDIGVVQTYPEIDCERLAIGKSFTVLKVDKERWGGYGLANL